MALDLISETKTKRYEIRRIIIVSAFIQKYYDVEVRGSEYVFYTTEQLVGLMAIKRTSEDLYDEFKKVQQKLNLPPMPGKKTVASLCSLLTT